MKWFAFSLLLLTVSCGGKRPAENYNLRSSADIILTESNHRHGWTKQECFMCHNPDNIHVVNNLNDSSFELAKDLVKNRGLDSCSGCHGRNGVE